MRRLHTHEQNARIRAVAAGTLWLATLLVLVATPRPAMSQVSKEEMKLYEGNYRLAVTPDPMGFFSRDGTLYLKQGGLGSEGQEVPLIYRDGKFVISPDHPNAFEFKIVDGEVTFTLYSGGNAFEGARMGEDELVGGEIFDLSDPVVWTRYWTDLRDRGLTSQEIRQRYLSDIGEELGITITEVEQEIEAKTPYWFFMLRAPTRIPEVFEAFLALVSIGGSRPNPWSGRSAVTN